MSKKRKKKKKRVLRAGPNVVRWIRIVKESGTPLVFFETDDANEPHGFFELDGTAATENAALDLVRSLARGRPVTYMPVTNPEAISYVHNDILITDSGFGAPDPDVSSDAHVESDTIVLR